MELGDPAPEKRMNALWVADRITAFGRLDQQWIVRLSLKFIQENLFSDV